MIITQNYEGITNGIISPVMICLSKCFCNKYNLPCIEKRVDAFWDTGTGTSCISKSLASELKITQLLIEDEERKGTGGSYLSNEYLIDLLLTYDYQISNLKVSDFVDNGKFDFLIGMDIITMGDFALTYDVARNSTVFSFRVPPSGIPIDFNECK